MASEDNQKSNSIKIQPKISLSLIQNKLKTNSERVYIRSKYTGVSPNKINNVKKIGKVKYINPEFKK
jgi:hypothetical protein